MDTQQVLFTSLNETTVDAPTIHHVISGSFRSLSLFLLAFSPLNRSLSHVQTIPGYGPHQYLATNERRDRVYATSWALPPALSSWHVERPATGPWTVSHINSVPITATSSYITVSPPYTHIYSAGGPTGEVHRVDPTTGGFREKVQEYLFVPEDDLPTADKTRVALTYGSHGVEFTPSSQLAFIPVLGSNTIEVYSHDRSSGLLTHIRSVPSPRGPDPKDGPRHVKIHPNGKILYCITEHTNYVDAYRITDDSLAYVSSRSILPEDAGSSAAASNHHFRGDTLHLPSPTPQEPSPRVLITTTRGSSSELRGWLSIFPLDEEGIFSSLPIDAERFQTPTSGGKANAIDILAKSSSSSQGDGLWILLTDDDDVTASSTGTGAVRVLEWDGWDSGGVKVVSEWPSEDDKGAQANERIRGASHAIWLD